ncbi:dihydrofolate reductase family protein [Candidatus Woesearchaeota archaeon]|nr:dihydrofolate reductase family protein [Candidatus Woesearchaeota archaeon]
MRKVNLFIACSLDGYIAGPKGEIDWLFSDGDYGYSKFYKSVDAIIMGRKTYELSLSFDSWPHTGKKTYVLSRKNNKPDSRVEFAKDGVELTKKLLKTYSTQT